MSIIVDFNNLHIESETAEEAISFFQECEIGKYLDEGKKNKSDKPKYEKQATLFLYISLGLYLICLTLMCLHFERLEPLSDLLFGLSLLCVIIGTICVHHLFSNKLITSLSFLGPLIIMSFAWGLTSKKETIKAMMDILKPEEVAISSDDNAAQTDSLSQGTIQIDSIQ